MAPQRDQVADRIRLLLEEHSWSEYELAKRAGLSDSHIGLILKRGTALAHADRSPADLAAACGVPWWFAWMRIETMPDSTGIRVA